MTVDRISSIIAGSLSRLGAGVIRGLTTCACVAAVGACAAGAGDSPGTPEAVATRREALVTTSYTVQIEGLDVWSTKGVDFPYVVWAGLGTRVNRADPLTIGCLLGNAPSNSRLGPCVDGTWTAGSLLSRPITVGSLDDSVRIAIVLSNVESPDNSPIADSQFQSHIAATGDLLQGVGTITALSAPVGGAVIGVIGAAISIAADLLGGGGSDFKISCRGGLIGGDDSNWKAQDTLNLRAPDGQALTGQKLLDMTASGPAYITMPLSVQTPGTSACSSSMRLRLSITRDWNTGLAPAPKSGDSAEVRIPGVANDPQRQGEINVFDRAGDGALLRRWWSSSGWSAKEITSQHLLAGQFDDIATISRTPGNIDAFWFDSNGNLMSSYWAEGMSGFADGFAIPGAYSSPGAHLSVTSRRPGLLEVFYIGTDGALWTSKWDKDEHPTWATWTPRWETQALSQTWIAQPGSGIAAVARTANNADVFFFGNDGALYSSYTSSYSYDGQTPWTTFRVQPQNTPQTGLAPKGANVTAVARTTQNLDVFFVGNDGHLYTSYWFNGAPAWNTIPVQGAVGIEPGKAVSAVSRTSDNIDVAFLDGSGRFETSAWSSNSNWNTVVQDQTRRFGGDKISIVARTPWNLDVFFKDAWGQTVTSYWAYGAVSWTTFVLTDPPPPLTVTLGTTTTSLTGNETESLPLQTSSTTVTGPVTFTVTGLPAGVTAHVLTPNAKVGDTAYLALWADVNAGYGSSTAFVTATAGSVTGTAAIRVNVAPCVRTTSCGAACGSISDNCGGTLKCASCPVCARPKVWNADDGRCELPVKCKGLCQ